MPPSELQRQWHRPLTFIRYAVGFGLLYFVIRSAGGIGGERGLLGHPVLVLVFATQAFLGAGVEAVRLDWLLRSQGLRLEFLQGYRLVAVGTFFNFSIPGGTGGDVMKLYYLASDRRKHAVEVATVLLVDRMMGLSSLLLISIGVIALQPGLRSDPVVQPLLALLVGVFVGVLVLLFTAVSETARRSRVPTWLTTKAPLHGIWRRLLDAFGQFRGRWRSLAGAFGISLAGQILLASAFGLAGSLLIGSSPVAAGGLALVALVANAIPLTPGGLGVGEAAFEGLFRAVGHSGGAQLVLAWRLGLLPLAVVGALLYARGVRRSGAPMTRELAENTGGDRGSG